MIQIDTKESKGKISQYSVMLYPADVALALAKAKDAGMVSFSALVRQLLQNYLEDK